MVLIIKFCFIDVLTSKLATTNEKFHYWSTIEYIFEKRWHYSNHEETDSVLLTMWKIFFDSGFGSKNFKNSVPVRLLVSFFLEPLYPIWKQQQLIYVKVSFHFSFSILTGKPLIELSLFQGRRERRVGGGYPPPASES
jgi:hypothetical protein